MQLWSPRVLVWHLGIFNTFDDPCILVRHFGFVRFRLIGCIGSLRISSSSTLSTVGIGVRLKQDNV